MEKQDVYQLNGYKDRKDYLKSLADEFMVDESIVYALADLLGAGEDFDGLVTELEDLCCIGWGG